VTGVIEALVIALLGVGRVEGTLRAPDIRTQDAVVYLVPLDSAGTPGPEAATIDQRNLRFVPRVLAVTPSSEVAFLNSDPLVHNVFSPPGSGVGFNLGSYRVGERRSQVFVDEGAHVILCHIHPEMAAYVVVVPTLYRAITDRDGGFRIDSIPPGRYQLRTWHSRLAPTTLEVIVADGQVTRVDITGEARRRSGGGS